MLDAVCGRVEFGRELTEAAVREVLRQLWTRLDCMDEWYFGLSFFCLWKAQHRMYSAAEALKWLQLWKLCCSSLQAPCMTCSERLEGLILRGAAADAVHVTCTCITDVLALRPQLCIRMIARHNSTCICMCSVEAAQDLGPKGQVGEEGRCRVRTRSFGWRARLDVLPRDHGIWDVVSSTAPLKC